MIEIHEKEKKAILAIQNNKYFNTVIKFIVGNCKGTFSLGELLDRNFPVTEVTCPSIYNVYLETLEKLGIKEKYPLFMVKDYTIRVKSAGEGKNISLSITSKTVDTLSLDEIKVLLAHELTHIYLGHLKYYGMLEIIKNLKNYLGIIKQIPVVGKYINLDIVSDSLLGLFLNWAEAAEYSADLGALFVCEDKDLVKNVIEKQLGRLGDNQWLLRNENITSDIPNLDYGKLSYLPKIVLCKEMLKPDNIWGVKRIMEIG